MVLTLIVRLLFGRLERGLSSTAIPEGNIPPGWSLAEAPVVIEFMIPCLQTPVMVVSHETFPEPTISLV